LWLQLWSHVRIDLGLTDEEFYDLTPRQIDALSKRFRDRATERASEQEFLFAQLTTYVVNFSHWPPKEPASPKDFMPSEMRRRAMEKPKRMTRKRRQEVADAWRIYLKLAAGMKV
jgi:hypothetical protein